MLHFLISFNFYFVTILLSVLRTPPTSQRRLSETRYLKDCDKNKITSLNPSQSRGGDDIFTFTPPERDEGDETR